MFDCKNLFRILTWCVADLHLGCSCLFPWTDRFRSQPLFNWTRVCNFLIPVHIYTEQISTYVFHSSTPRPNFRDVGPKSRQSTPLVYVTVWSQDAAIRYDVISRCDMRGGWRELTI
jgi:hypothetical protein